MQLQITDHIMINAAAQQVWHVVAHQFAEVGHWTSLIPQSQAVDTIPIPEGAIVGGRVCSTRVAGFRAVQETLTAYDELGMRYTYEATDGLPIVITRAINSWAVHPLTAETSLVEARAELTLRPVLGFFLRPLMQLQLQRTTTRVFEELKYYLEQGQPHPRKLRTRHR